MDICWLGAAAHYSRKWKSTDRKARTNEKVQRVRTLGAKPNSLSLTPRTHVVE